MVLSGIEQFNNKNVLLLQGPVGPFFKRFAFDLKQAGANVYKINFNGGDSFFYPTSSIHFRKSFGEWPEYFLKIIEQHKIDSVLLFGDCRMYHRIARSIAQAKGLYVGVYEEGYIRPNFITFENLGTNGHSKLPKNADFYNRLNDRDILRSNVVQLGNSFWYAAWYAMLYYLFSALLSPLFPYYQHHRSLELSEIRYWIKSIWRKQYYKLKEFRLKKYLNQQMHKEYFLVPLQVATDFQIREHSSYDSCHTFIKEVMRSFSKYSPSNTLLVIKHHPLDRGHNDYQSFIERKAVQYGIKNKVYYIHDLHLPTLLHHARGVVVINSTVGLSAFNHNLPVKTMGQAIYDLPGLTYQKSLDSFWTDAHFFKIDQMLRKNFQGYLIKKTQINGSFYLRIANSSNKSGIRWK